jgi:carboxymethylenebutenolidase
VCYGDDARAPGPPNPGPVGEHGHLVLQSVDGTEFGAYFAHPEEPTGRGIVIFPDVRGLHHFYRDLAHSFAAAGVSAVAFDYFGRTAGAEKRGDDFEYMPHVQATTREGIDADVRASVEYLQEQGAQSIFTVGFCFGGRQSWISAARGHGLSGAIGFYGRPGLGQDGSAGPIQLAGEFEAPILGLMGGADEGIPQADVDAFDEALTAAGVEHELVVYPGAPHSFFDRKQEEFADASEDAWSRVLSFIDRHSG